MTTTKVNLEFMDGSETLIDIHRYMEYMDRINESMPDDMKNGPMTLELAIHCLIDEGLKAVKERSGKDG